MTKDEMREQTIQGIAELLRRNAFSVEFKVTKKPKGVKIIYEVTQEEMNAMAEKAQHNQ